MRKVSGVPLVSLWDSHPPTLALENISDADSEEEGQVGGRTSSVQRPSKRCRREDYRSKSVINPPSIRSKPSSSSRTRMVSSGAVLVSDLQRLARSFNDEHITTQELLQAQKAVNGLGAVIHEALERRIGGE